MANKKKRNNWIFIVLFIFIVLAFFLLYDDSKEVFDNDRTSSNVIANSTIADDSNDSDYTYYEGEDEEEESTSSEVADGLNRYIRNINAIDYSRVSFKPWDVNAASLKVGKQGKKPYTIMVYMNGSNLESESGAAVNDLIEMLEARIDSKNVNIVILTGGTKKWQNFDIPSAECSLLQIIDSDLYFIDTIGSLSIGDAGTLSSFIDFGINNFPADKYGLIMWDHGGGSIYGFGYDEKFKGDGLTLLEMNRAFHESVLGRNDINLEFIGFDACLMASVEMASVASNYAKYMIASEDLEPGYGWNYYFLTELNKNPNIRGDNLGRSIVDTFMEFYDGYDEDVTLSVIDLSEVDFVLGAMDSLMGECVNDLNSGNRNFRLFSKRRASTKTFGNSNPRDNDYDMVDLGDMAEKLSDLYPGAASYMKMALERAVIYNKHNSYADDIHGLTGFYIYGEKTNATYAIQTYESLKMSEKYTKFQERFANEMTGETLFSFGARSRPVEQSESGDYFITLSKEEMDNLTDIKFTVWEPVLDKKDYYYMIGVKDDVDIGEDGTIKTKFEGIWPGVDGQFVCLYQIGEDGNEKTYAIPAKLNGNDVNIIVVYSDKYKDGKILGARRIAQGDNDMAQKGLVPIKDGDTVAFCYFSQYLGQDPGKEKYEWYVGEDFKVSSELKLERYQANEGDVYLYGFMLTDTQRNEYYSDFIEVTY